MRRVTFRKSTTCALVLTLTLLLAACSGQTETESGNTSSEESTAATTIPRGAEPVPAFSAREKANEAAKRWQRDARIYSITAAPVNAEGLSRRWNYAYVSRSAGAISVVMVSGGEVNRNPERQLPEQRIENITNDILPESRRLIDSTEAMQESGEIRKFLEEQPEARASMGLDSASSERPTWILSVLQQEEPRERIPATEGS